MSDGHSPLARGLLVVVMMVGVLGFGAIGLCGGFFTVGMVSTLFTPDSPAAVMMMVISVPSLLGGCFMVWLCIKQIAGLVRPSREDRADE